MGAASPHHIADSNGNLAANIAHFARALRAAGLPVGPGRVADAVRAVARAGFTQRRDFYWVLHACFVSRPEHRAVFRQIFQMYWRDPNYLDHVMAILMPAMRRLEEERAPRSAERRAAEALLDGAQTPELDTTEVMEAEIEVDVSQTWSSEEKLKAMDFEQMSTAEIAQAKRLISKITLPVRPIVSRRTKPALQGRLPDWRSTMRASLRRGGELRELSMRARRARWPNLVALCDISGSMSAYSRLILHFLHSASNAKGAGWADVHSFTFGTRLTNITRYLQGQDVDAALVRAGAEAPDWEGGTRIGACLRDFNRDWSRRVLGQGAVVLLITDGLDRDDPVRLGREMERLHLSARRVIWLNPLLRWDGFQPKARGVIEMLPHVDSFRAGHNVASLEGLAAALTRPDDAGEKARLMHMMGA